MNEKMEGINNKQMAELLELAYDHGYNEGYKKGCDEAWEAAKKLELSSDDGGMSGSIIHEIFDVPWCSDVLSKFSAFEVIARIKAYEEKKQKENEFRVGDEIEDKLLNKGVIVKISDDYISVLWNDVSLSTYNKLYYHFTKTGRHFPEMVELIKKMKEEE